MKCVACEDAKAEYEEPCEPLRLAEGICLCGPCFLTECDGRIADLETELDDLRSLASGVRVKMQARARAAKRRRKQ